MGVTGIGGLFFRSRDPEALAAWYRTHLNVGGGCVADPATLPDPWTWETAGGPVVFAPLPADTDQFAADRAWMLNLRVTDLERLVRALRDAAIPVEERDEWNGPETGRFARLKDPEGNPLELWEPPA